MKRTAAMIVAMTKNRVIGRDGTIPWHYSADLKRFKRMTLDSTVIMGRKTWESLHIQPLPQRHNVVVTRGHLSDVEHYNCIEKAIAAAKCEKLWVIGGASIYKQAIDYCRLIDITYVPDHIDSAHCALFPEIDWSQWTGGPKAPLEDDSRLVNQQFTLKQ